VLLLSYVDCSLAHLGATDYANAAQLFAMQVCDCRYVGR
jgi:hypothetical protein